MFKLAIGKMFMDFEKTLFGGGYCFDKKKVYPI